MAAAAAAGVSSRAAAGGQQDEAEADASEPHRGPGAAVDRGVARFHGSLHAAAYADATSKPGAFRTPDPSRRRSSPLPSRCSNNPVSDVAAVCVLILTHQIGKRGSVDDVGNRLADPAPEPEEVALAVEVTFLVA